MKILKLSILNFLGIEAFKATPGKLNKIEGGNGVGKSAVLKAIREAFKSSGVDPHLIKAGSDKGEIYIELSGDIVVKRQLTRDTNRVTVTAAGQPLSKAQTFLTSLIGANPFDPTAFYLAPPKERVKMLLAAMPITMDLKFVTEQLAEQEVPIDLTRFDYTRHGLEVLKDIQTTVYERRHEVNNERTRMRKAIEQDKLEIPETFDTTKWSGFNLSEASGRLRQAQGLISEHNEDLRRLGVMKSSKVELEATIEDLRRRLVKAETALTDLKSEGKALQEKCQNFAAPDIEAIQADIDGYEKAQRLISKIEQIKSREDDLVDSDRVHAVLDSLYGTLTTEVPQKLLKKASLPVKDLSIDGDQIMINGVSIDKLSTSEQMRFAVSGIAKPLSGQLKVICVDRFESLDAEARKAFEAEAAGDDFEYFVTTVTEGPLTMEASGDIEHAEAVAAPVARNEWE